MKVLDINNLYSTTGGGIRVYHHEKLKWCKANGIENILLYPASHNTSASLNGGIVKGLKSPGLGKSGYHYFINGKAVREALGRIDPDVVELGSGIVVPGMVRRVLHDTPAFAYFHSNWPETLPMSVLGINSGAITRVFQKISIPFMYRSYKTLDGVIGASNYSIQKLHEAGLTKLSMVPLGANTDIFHPAMRSLELRRSLGVPEGGKMILYMGRLAPEKGIRVLLKACTKLFKEKGVVLVVAGGGHWNKQVEQMKMQNPGKMTLLSRVNSRTEAASLMASADVFVSAGPLETFSLATLEALNCGTPVAACSRGAASELVLNAGGNSVYSPWNSGEALAEAILKALASGKAQKDDFRNFAEKYTWDACFRRIFDIYTVKSKVYNT